MTLFTRITFLGALAGAFAVAQPLPKAETILDRYSEVTGGKAAYQKHTHETMTGTISFPAQGLGGKLTRYASAPDQEYSALELGPIGKIESGFTNGVAWEKSSILGPRVKTGDERDQPLAKPSSTRRWDGARFFPRPRRLARNP